MGILGIEFAVGRTEEVETTVTREYGTFGACMHVNLQRVSVQSSELIALVLVSHNRASRKDDVRETVRDVKCAIRRYKTAGKGFVNTTQRERREEERKERESERTR